MIKVIKTWDKDHNDYVVDEVNRLERNGYEVYKIKRINHAFLCFGDDVTNIYYRDKSYCKNKEE
jgi:hypothetical protein